MLSHCVREMEEDMESQLMRMKSFVLHCAIECDTYLVVIIAILVEDRDLHCSETMNTNMERPITPQSTGM